MIWLFFLFTVVPATELYLLIKIGGAIGVLETIWLVLLTGFVGAWAAKSQGRQIFIDIQRASSRGEIPTRKLIEGALIFVGGILLITPGVITDALGLSFIFPLTRIGLAFFLQKKVGRAIQSGTFKVYGAGPGGFKAGGFHYSSTTIINSQNPGSSSSERDVTPRNQGELPE